MYFGCCSVSGEHHGIYLGRVHVYVKNLIAPNKILNLHCKSKDNDLGLHKLAYRQNQTWSFKVNFMGSTLFWCGMVWQDDRGHWVQGSFIIYKYTRDYGKCDGICVWDVQKNGLYFLNPETKNPPELLAGHWKQML
ncbi:hypothetical protein AQUCO_00200208v1 [Aquilegia coerulea]|uniref:S-protein homolog n=1 Tax=Aquilegia coerulea TaxID=218851 RepID=A0A2G5F214_AQUCA|nr:hypothetical protein AQUCO_00200208v1 [Aquilegia coerulea]